MLSPQHNYTLAEYWRMLETFPNHKYEYIHGDIRMMTGGTLAHAQIGQNIGSLLWLALPGHECHVHNSAAVLKLSNDICYCPDVSIGLLRSCRLDP